MFSINIIFKIFLITFIFKMIILTSDSIEYPCFPTSKSDKKEEIKLHQMVMRSNTIENDEDYHQYKFSDLKPYEKKLNFEDYYNTVYNLQYIRIPKEEGPLDYDAYEKKIQAYCDNEYMTSDSFRIKSYFITFKNALITMRNCMDGVLKEQAMKREDEPEHIPRRDAIVALDWTPMDNKKNNKNYSEELINTLKRVNDCLNLNRLKNFVDCLDYSYVENEKSKKYAKVLLGRLKAVLQDNYDNFVTCITLFNNNFSNIFPVKKNDILSIRSLYLTKSIVFHFDPTFSDINVEKLFYNYTRLFKTEVTENDRKYCIFRIEKMEEGSYKSNKLAYQIYPKLSDYYSWESYKTERIKALYKVARDDINKYNSYIAEKSNTELMNERDIKNLIKRRARLGETYDAYAIRISKRGYFPLPKNLWNKELALAHNKEMQEITNQELNDDIMKLNEK